jgi:hypothetical protein
VSLIESLGTDALNRFDAAVASMRSPPPGDTIEQLQAKKIRWVKKLLAREMEAIALYEPLPLSALFHSCNALWRIVDGSNRAGKTLAASAESAFAATGTHPHNAYPPRNGLAMFVGLERKHLRLMYRNLFCEGSFKLVKDEFTGLPRSVRWDRANPTCLQPYDESMREKWFDAPPLIPPRMVLHASFDEPEVPRLIRLTNGWRMMFQSAAGEPDRGSHYNYAYFDEEMPDPRFYDEAHRGLTRIWETFAQRPKGVWAATAQVANIRLSDLRDKAEADPESSDVRQFVYRIDDNAYFSSEARASFRAGLSDADVQTRYFGIPAARVRAIYEYKPLGNAHDGTGHGCDPFAIDPAKYARYVVIDPGIKHCVALFVAIDPIERHMTIYDGVELNEANPKKCAAEIKARQCGFKYEAVVFDAIMLKHRNDTRDQTTVGYEHQQALKEAGVQIRRYGPVNGFIPSVSDIYARQLALTATMEVRGTGPHEGTCKLRVFRCRMPLLDKQIRSAQTDPKNPQKRHKDPKVPCDWIDTAEYAAAAKLGYHVPEACEPEKPPPTAYEILRDRRKRSKLRRRHAASA